MRFFGKRTVREKEIRRSLSELMPTWTERVLEPLRSKSLLIVAIGALGCSVIVNVGTDAMPFIEGQRVGRAISARVPLRIADEARSELVRQRAKDTAADYFTLDASLVTEIRGRLVAAQRIAKEQSADPAKVIEGAATIGLKLDEAAARELIRLAAGPSADTYERAVDRAIDTLRQQPLVEPEDPTAPRGTPLTAVLIDPDDPDGRELSINRLLFANVREDVARVADAVVEPFPVALRSAMRSAVLAMLGAETDGRPKPLYRFDSAASSRAADEAAARVPEQYVEYPVDSRLADVGEISPQELTLLREEHERFLNYLESDPSAALKRQQQAAARGGMAFLVVLSVGAAIVLRNQAAMGGLHQQIATTVVLLAALATSRTIFLFTPYAYLGVGVQAFIVLLLAITTFGRASGIATGALFALINTLAMRQGIAFLVVLAAVSLLPFLLLRDVRHRGRIIGVGSLSAAAAAVTTVLVGVTEGQSIEFVFWTRALWALVATLAAAFLVEGLLPAIERFFGVTTNMTLLEWCDPNRPLLRMLAAEAPGTYNHSLMVGTLAGAAAEAIGANALLTRAGAYYHDIGKINKPEYFVENQDVGEGNRHDRLTPAMSHLVIVGHVKNGLAMAREYGLPAPLHAFIPEHHGTCVVEYFFHAANRARKPDDPEISDDQFRYPGPKPQSRETAIVMCCDSIEGAVRAMPDPTPGRIEDVVQRIVEKRLSDGQFDECDLTFRELALVRESLVKSLISVYHGRIRYPSETTDDEPPAPQRASS